MGRRGRAAVGGGMLALFVIALGIFLLPFAFPTPPPIVTRFQATRLLSPNEDGRRDRARVSVRMREPGEVTLRIADADGNLVRTLTDRQRTPRGWVRAAWDGGDEDGNQVPDGIYSVELRARAGQKRFNTSRRIVVDTQGPGIAQAEVQSAGLGEVAPPTQCLVTAVPDGDAIIAFAARRFGAQEPLRRFGPRPGRTGQTTRWAWDGLAAGRRVIRPGLVDIEVRASDPARNVEVRRRTCWVGNLVGRVVPAVPRPGGRERVRLTTPQGAEIPARTRVTLRLYRRVGTPGRSFQVLGSRVARPVRTTAGDAAIRLPSTIRPDALWLVAATREGEALIDLSGGR